MIVEHVDFVCRAGHRYGAVDGFYRDTLGLPQIGEGGFPEFKLGDNGFLYLIEPSDRRRVHARRTRRLRAARAGRRRGARELEAQGVEFDGDTLDTGVCHMAFFADPDGNRIMLHRRYAPRD